MEYPKFNDGKCASPPYRVNAYAEALAGGLPSTTLTASVGPGATMTLRTPYGNPVKALEGGSYQLVVRDSSRVENFHLSGPGVNIKTNLAYRGTKTWKVALHAYADYTYRSDRRMRQRCCHLNPRSTQSADVRDRAHASPRRTFFTREKCEALFAA
jgi:hypothetical protein